MKIDTSKLKNIPILCIYLLGFAAVTIVELLGINQSAGSAEIELTFNIQNFKTNFPGIVVCYIALALYTIATMMKCNMKFKSSNTDFLDIQSKISEWSKTKYIPTVFSKYAAFANKKRKVNAWKKKISIKWQRLEKLQTEKDYESWTRFLVDKETNPQALAPNKYCRTRQKLEEKLNKDYIDDNIERLDVRYDSINASLVLGGTKSNGHGYEDDEYITKNKVGIVVMERVPHYLMNMAIIATITSVSVDAFQIDPTWTVILLYFFNMIVKIASMLFTIYSTTRYAEAFNEKVTMKDMRFRWGICCEYQQWYDQQIKLQSNKEIINGDTNNRTN